MANDFQPTPWGVELVWANNNKYWSRALIIAEGRGTPYLYHKKQDITILVLQGLVRLVVEGRERMLNEGSSYHIPPKLKHKIVAIKGDATILETGTKSEDDVVLVEE